MIKRVGYLLMSLAMAAILLPAGKVFAASATLYLAPASGSVTNGSNFSVAVRENSGGQAVNGVQANLTYPASLFNVVSVNSSSAFSVVAQNSYGNGSIQIGRGAIPSVSGDQLVATIVFKAKASSGTASVSFASGSSVAADDGQGSNILSNSSGGRYSLRAPAPAAPVAPKDTTPPTISGVKVSSVSFNSVVIGWTTSEPATSEIDYGLNTGYGLTAVDGHLVTDHKLTLNSPLITPATDYHFMVKSSDAAGNNASSGDSSFRTSGATLKVNVVNQKSKPVKGAIVSFAGQKATTDKNGQATLTSLPTGNQTGYVEAGGKKTIETVNIPSSDLTKPATVSFKISTSTSYLPLLVGALVLVALAVLAFVWQKYYKHPPTLPPQADLSQQLSSTVLDTPKPPAAPLEQTVPAPPATPTPGAEGQIVRPTQPPEPPASPPNGL